jgi:hypothetical protein
MGRIVRNIYHPVIGAMLISDRGRLFGAKKRSTIVVKGWSADYK